MANAASCEATEISKISEIRRNLNFGRSHTVSLGLSPVVSQVVSLAFRPGTQSKVDLPEEVPSPAERRPLCDTGRDGYILVAILVATHPSEIQLKSNRSQVLIQNAIGALHPFPVHQTTPIAGVHKGHIVAGQNPEVLKDLTQSPKRRQKMAGIPRKYVRISTNCRNYGMDFLTE